MQNPGGFGVRGRIEIYHAHNTKPHKYSVLTIKNSYVVQLHTNKNKKCYPSLENFYIFLFCTVHDLNYISYKLDYSLIYSTINSQLQIVELVLCHLCY